MASSPDTASAPLTGATVATCALVAAGMILSGVFLQDAGSLWAHVAIGLISALAVVVGAWFAPPTSLVGGRARASLTPAQRRVKTVQLISAGIATVATAAFLTGSGRAMGAIAGIVVAGIVGLTWRPEAHQVESGNGHDR